MIPVKVQCACGQRYAFDVEPVNGAMPAAVACPSCGTDGTGAANEQIAQASAAPAAPGTRLRVSTPVAAMPGGSEAPPVERTRAVPPMSQYSPKPTPAKDGWDAEESDVNKLGTYIIALPAGVSALLAWGIFGLSVPPMILWIVVSVCGLIGGALNLAGRGPILAGAMIGAVVALGGFGAVYWWIADRKSIYVWELIIAFMVGAIPGLVLHKGIQYLWRRRAQAV